MKNNVIYLEKTSGLEKTIIPFSLKVIVKKDTGLYNLILEESEFYKIRDSEIKSLTYWDDFPYTEEYKDKLRSKISKLNDAIKSSDIEITVNIECKKYEE